MSVESNTYLCGSSVEEVEHDDCDTSSRSDNASDSLNVHADELFLDPEERYEIYAVKCAERPQLSICDQSGRNYISSNDKGTGSVECEEKKVDPSVHADEVIVADDSHFIDSGETSEEDHGLPLIDGCDLPGWRREGFVAVSKSGIVEGGLNVGSSSSLFRRESTLRVASIRNVGETSVWTAMKKKFSTEPPPAERDAVRVDSAEYSEPVVVGGRTTTKFAKDFERRNIPAKILGCTSSWDAMPDYIVRDKSDAKQHVSLDDEYRSKLLFFDEGGVGGWTFANLLKRFGDIMWRFSDTHGEMLSLSTYSKYITNLEGLTDDSPLAIYDAEFGDNDSPTCPLREEYDVPKCFSADLFDLASSGQDDIEHRPPYRWILIGPERSGTGMHIDPLWTNAWVTVLQGLKRWLLFPPCTPAEKIGMIEGQAQIPSVVWFRDYYDTVTSADWPEEWRPVEVLQRPGETVFVPNGWGHLVLNLKLTVAVTHNFASEFGPFERMWEQVAMDEPEFALQWYKGMIQNREDLGQRVWDCYREAASAGKGWASDLLLPNVADKLSTRNK
uniref:JmjC domain-containing protein n=1 Tax=Odontella aurita TaxID=265563 RepID=A0A7S4ILZ4_9STRA|mmetsp:Transcript_27060/g.79985  ORF Transcript_27060/g.79985 Transcript_27060/m.79985 type:complete len:557 (+) Transcript_27060:40-1710(+)